MFSSADLNFAQQPAAFGFSPTHVTSSTASLSGALNFSQLPAGIQRQILVFAARSDRRLSLNLARVSRTIQPWIDGIIYAQVHLLYLRTVRLFLRTLNERPHARTKPMGFFELTVRSIFVCADAEPESVLAILSACRGVTDLSYYGGRLSVHLDESHPIFIFRPNFGIPFFAAVTHLSLVNEWDEWTSWTWSAINTETMPALVCLKFDLAVGQNPPTDGAHQGGSRSRWLDIVSDICPTARGSEESESEDTFGHPLHSASRAKMEKVASAISDVLNNHASLRICVLILRFDMNPEGTAKIISRLASLKFNINRSSQPQRALVDDSETPKRTGFDPRLVFAWEKEPFRYSYADSVHEGMIWKSAEAVTKAQRYLSGYILLNCDCLI
ncbi:hypothetical protein GALMADRAFT_227772 [Galerina marginata CBS 339.88]|uniref:Uncharacterized protein n=1 Tax=Galerina marginata (strain CBS 339.88) TaxID=685588 RepID=A0A067SVJ6_GALM3|nr:hypothetical protein GALMADRAFT_227772 [Galerina marginata CBS 339.88]